MNKPIRELRIVRQENPVLRTSHHAFEYEPFESKGLQTLRRIYQTAQIVQDCQNDFHAMLALRNWLSERWDHGYCNATRSSSNGLDYLRRAERGESFTCAVFALTLVELLTSVGIPSRSLTISRGNSDFIGPHDEVGHCVSEAWSNHFQKWIALDADTASHFERDGVPLSALEIRESWLTHKGKDLIWARGARIPRHRLETFDGDKNHLARSMAKFLKHQTVDFYEYIHLHLTNRHYGGAEQRGTLAWFDQRRPPRLVRYNVAVPGGRYISSSRKADFEYELNRPFISIEALAGRNERPNGRIQLTAEVSAPWFSHYETKTGQGPWRTRKLPWRETLSPGDTTVAIRPINLFGRPGIPSSVTLRRH